jgi:anti-sigma-K factor RskA
VRLHLSDCPTCRAELSEITSDLAFVATSVEQHPLPQGARQRFVSRIAATAPTAEKTEVIPMVLKKSGPRKAIWIPWVALAAAVIIAVSLGLQVRFLNQQLEIETTMIGARNAENLKARKVMDVLTAPTAQRVELTASKTPPAPSARAVYLASRGALILQASNLKALPSDKTYELWVIPANGTAPIPAGLFRPDTAGSASVVLPEIPQGVAAKAFGVTIENAGGSNTPTAPIILAGAASASGE